MSLSGDEFVVDLLMKAKNHWRDVGRRSVGIGENSDTSPFMRKADAVEEYLRQNLDPEQIGDEYLVYVAEALQLPTTTTLAGTDAERKRWEVSRSNEVAKLQYEIFKRDCVKGHHNPWS